MRGVDHVGVSVSDLERSLRFYRDLLGLEVLGTETDDDPELAAIVGLDAVSVTIADLNAGDGRIVELLQYHEPPGAPVHYSNRDPGSMHVALGVDDLPATLERLAAAGVEQISTRPVTIDAPGSSWHGATCAYVRDPDGAVLELIQRPN